MWVATDCKTLFGIIILAIFVLMAIVGGILQWLWHAFLWVLKVGLWVGGIVLVIAIIVAIVDKCKGGGSAS